MYNSYNNQYRRPLTRNIDIPALLSTFDFFERCSESERLSIISACSYSQFKSGQTLIWEGSRCPDALLFVSGQIRVYLIGPNGREIQLYRLQGGHACAANLLSVLNDMDSLVHAVADTDLVAVRIPAVEFRGLVHTNASLHDFVMREIGARMANLISVTKTLAFVKVEQRVTDFLTSRCVREGQQRVVYATHSDIASELGTAREVVSRTLKQLERAGVIGIHRGKVTLTTPDLRNTAAATPLAAMFQLQLAS